MNDYKFETRCGHFKPAAEARHFGVEFVDHDSAVAPDVGPHTNRTAYR